MTAAPAFDRVADQYDRLWTESPIGRAQRDAVWREVDPLFAPGQRVLDIGCGTGADAAHLAARGVRVHAIDPSPRMIEVARRRGGFTADVLGADEIAGEFDGAISNFGALNCVSDLRVVGQRLARVVRPGGYVAICTIGRFCWWEALWSWRRLRGSAGSSLGVTVRYWTVAEMRDAFREFELKRWMGVGLFVPPSYVGMPAWLVRWCAALDRVLARVPGLRAMADHRLLIFERRAHAG